MQDIQGIILTQLCLILKGELQTTPSVIFCVDWTIEFAGQLPELGRETLSPIFTPRDDFAFQLIAKRKKSTNSNYDFDLDIYLQAVAPTPVESEWTLSGYISAAIGKKYKTARKNGNHFVCYVNS